MQAQTELLWSDNYAVGHIFYTTQTPFVRGIHDVKDYVEVTGETYFDDRELLERVLYDIYGNIVSIQTFGTDSDYDKTIIDYQFDNSDNVYLLNNERLEFYKSRIVLQKYSWMENCFGSQLYKMRQIHLSRLAIWQCQTTAVWLWRP